MDDYACMFCDGHHGPERGLVNFVRILADQVKELESKLGGWMSRPYTEYHPIGENTNQRLDAHEKRIKELESKLGAAAAEQTASASGVPEGPAVRLGGSGVSGTAAPSVSAEEWHGWARENRRDGRNRSARACDLAAAVTEWLQRHELDDSRNGESEEFLFNTIFAFVRGEPLPQKGG